MGVRREDTTPAASRRAGCAAGAALLGPCLLAAIGYVGWAVLTPPPAVPQPALPEPNGYDRMAAAVAELGPIPERSYPYDVADGKNVRAVRAVLASRSGAVTRLRGAARYDFPVQPALVRSFAGDPALEAAFEWLRLFMAEAESRRANAEATDRFLDLLELDVAAGGAGGIVMFDSSAETYILRLTAREARSAGERLDRIAARMPTLVSQVRDDYRISVAELRELFASGTAGETIPLPWGLESVGPLRAAKEAAIRLAYPRPLAYWRLRKHFLALEVEAVKPYWQRRDVTRPADAVLEGIVPYWERGAEHTADVAVLRLLRLEVGLQAYRQERGRYPRTLAALSGYVPGEEMVDPFSGKPMRYRPGTARGSSGLPFLLYSVGCDGVDDGGKRMFVNYEGGDAIAGHLHWD